MLRSVCKALHSTGICISHLQFYDQLLILYPQGHFETPASRGCPAEFESGRVSPRFCMSFLHIPENMHSVWVWMWAVPFTLCVVWLRGGQGVSLPSACWMLGKFSSTLPAFSRSRNEGGEKTNRYTAGLNPKCSLISTSICTNESYCSSPGRRSQQSQYHQYCVSRGRRQTAMATVRQEVWLLLEGIPEEELCVQQCEHRAEGHWRQQPLVLKKGVRDLL